MSDWKMKKQDNSIGIDNLYLTLGIDRIIS